MGEFYNMEDLHSINLLKIRFEEILEQKGQLFCVFNQMFRWFV